ncbi:uncharacterized protein arhgef5 isoform X1 [Stigmatopora nigra]
MGSKKPTCTVLESFPNTKTRDFSSGGRISRDSSPRAAMTTRSDREEGRRDREREKAKDKSKFRDADPRERYHEPGPAPRMREASREKKRDERRNGRPLSTLEREFEKQMEFDVKKGDTFPRMRRSRERDGGLEYGRPREKPRRTETDAWDRDRERARHREMERVEWRRYEKSKQRHHVSSLAFPNHRRDSPSGGSRDRRERDRARRRDISGGRDRGSRPDREDWERTRRKAGARGTRSEGDSDERETGRVRARERDELAYQHSRSEGDSKAGAAGRETDRDRRRGTDRSGRGEESKVDERALQDGGGRTRQRREREYYRGSGLREGRRRQEREADPRWDDTTLEEAAPRAPPPPKAQSSGEWSSDMDNDLRRRRGGDGHQEGESGRESEREDGNRAERREQRRRWIDGKEKGDGLPEHRRMWLEPQRGRNSKESSQEDDFGDREKPVREGERVESRRREDAERREGTNEDDAGELDRLAARDGHVGEIWPRDVEGGSNSEDSEGGNETGWRSDKERMLSGEDGFVTVSSGADDDDEDEREEFLDCQDYWEGGDTDDNSPKEEHANEEELTQKGREPKYVFCVIGQTLPTPESDRVSSSPVDEEEEEEEPRQNLIAESLSCQSPLDQRLLPDENLTNSHKRFSSPDDPRMRPRQPEHPYAKIGPFKRDTETEKLLMKWRQRSKAIAKREEEEVSALPKNPYADVYSQVTLDQILPALEGLDVNLMSPEEKEAIRIRMSGAWSMTEEPKRHSQAPHLKWAKNVVREILGHSGEELNEDHGSREPAPPSSQEEDTQLASEMSFHNSSEDELHSEPELEEEDGELLEVEVEGHRGTRQGREDMHADQFSAMHADTPAHYINADTLVDVEGSKDLEMTVRNESEPRSHRPMDKLTVDVNMTDCEQQNCEGEKETRGDVDMFLCVSNTLYKPSSCPILNCKAPLEFQMMSGEGGLGGEEEEDEEKVGWEEEEDEIGFPEGLNEVVSEIDESSVGDVDPEARKMGGGTLTSTSSFRDLGPEARLRRRGIRKTAERRNEALVEEEEEEEGVAGDRRTRIFNTTDEDDRSKSWGEVELRNVLDTIGRRKRNSKFFNRAQLYQQYSEAAQNFEILRQSRSDVPSACEDSSASSPAPSPPPARRPLPPLPAIPHPHSLSHAGSITSVKSLPLPEPPRIEGRPSSPRLSIALTESATLWRELPGVRNSGELEDITEDERRLQEVRFEVVTSEASYCRSLDIVVEHFVKSKQLGALLATQDRNWLFSRLADVRAISHSFLSKLEERLESDIMHFTVCDIIARHCQRFKMVYVPYLTNQSYQDATYQRLMNENPGFRRIVEKLERSPVCQRLPLRSFLVLPFQRITRIKLLVQNIVKRTTAGTAEATQAIKALRLLEKLILESNDSISQMKSIESLVSLSARVDFECRTLPLISQSRRLVREGPVTELMDFSLKDTERNIYMHLFNDYLLLSQQKEGGKFTVIDHAPVAELRAENCRVKLHSLQKNLFRLHTAHKSLLLRTDTQSDKLRWISALSRPHPEVDFSSAQDFPQMQCIRAVVAQQPDELSLEKADIILVHQQSSDHWVEGTRLSDGHRGWVPESHLELINNARVRQRNLSDALKLATAAV